MTVNGMMLLSKVFLGMMIFFVVTAIVVYFVLDVRKAWCMLTGKRIPVQSKKKDVPMKVKQVVMQKLREIERETKMGHSNINKCCKGDKKTAYGYIWKYA